MRIFSFIEHWTLEEGNYPTLSVGMAVRLAFQMVVSEIDTRCSEDKSLSFTHAQLNNYSVVGRVLKKYDKLFIVDAGEFSFYVENKLISQVSEGQLICMQGVLFVDYFVWTENVGKWEAAPNIFYPFKINNIARVTVPENTIHRAENGSIGFEILSDLSQLPSDCFTNTNSTDVSYMYNEKHISGYLLELRFLHDFEDSIPITGHVRN